MSEQKDELDKTQSSDNGVLEAWPWYESDCIYDQVIDACIHFAYSSLPAKQAVAEKVLIDNLPTLIMMKDIQTVPDPERLPAVDEFLLNLAYNSRRSSPAIAELAKEAITDPARKMAAMRQLTAVPAGTLAVSQLQVRPRSLVAA